MAHLVTDNVAPKIEESIHVDASPARVWELVSDLSNMGRWSPQCWKTFVRGGETRLGATAVNVNKRGLLVWPTRSRVVAFRAEREIAFTILDNQTTWSYLLEPQDGGTQVTAGRDASKGTTKISHVLVEKVLGGHDDFTAELHAGLRTTLGKIKAEAEARR